MPDSSVSTTLQYPLYLDVPMMISFLAALEDGVTYEENVHRRAQGRQIVSGEAQARVSLPSLLSVLPFDLRGRLTGGSATEETEELQLVKRHTEASLFNKLRDALYRDKIVQELDQSVSNESEIISGMIVEAGGVVVRNPLEELLTLLERFRPLMPKSAPNPPSSQQPGRRRGQTQSKSQSSQASMAESADSSSASTPIDLATTDPFIIFDWIREDLETSDLTDIVLETDHEFYPRIILTLLKDFGTGLTVDSLLGAEVGVIGKVSAVQTSGNAVNLLRRSILGFMPAEQQEKIFSGAGGQLGIASMSKYLEVQPPLIQIMPLAIFI
jgi:hypothetical protein